MRRSPAILRRLEAAHEARETARLRPGVVAVDFADPEAVARAYASGAVVVIPSRSVEPNDS